MKKLFRIWMLAAAAFGAGACEVEYEPIVVLPDATLENSGMVNVPSITIYQNDVYTVNMVRTEDDECAVAPTGRCCGR